MSEVRASLDGEGYPDGIAGLEIPLISRIIAVADSYNAMTSDRPYRDAMPSRVARLRLAQAVDSQFDTAVVAAFEAILASAAEDYGLHIVATSASSPRALTTTRRQTRRRHSPTSPDRRVQASPERRVQCVTASRACRRCGVRAP